jgi:DNA (cytosine-5)-methyltransferase 1
MGNGVNVGAVWHVIREHVRRDAVFLANLEHEDVERIEGARVLLRAVNAAPKRPNEILSKHRPALAD